MKQYFSPLFITLLGLFAVYILYALWHTEEVNLPKVIEPSKEIILKNTLSVPEVSLDTDVQAIDEKEIEEMRKEQENIPSFTPQQMEEQTQALDDSLTLDDYEETEETMEEENEAFESLDDHVEELDVKLAEEMQDVEESQEDTVMSVPENVEEMVMSVPENEEEMVMFVPENEEDTVMSVPENIEEIDMEQEDLNNL